MDVYLNSFTKKENFTFTLDDLKLHDPMILSLIQEILSCDNSYINKCKSTRGNANQHILNNDHVNYIIFFIKINKKWKQVKH